MLQQRVMPRIGLLLMNTRIFLVEIAERYGPGRTGVLARRLHFIDADRPVLALGGASRPADALDAIGALFHHAARAHRDLRIFLTAVGLQSEIGVFLAVGVSEEIEAANLVRAIRLAKSCPDAAVVDLHVKA